MEYDRFSRIAGNGGDPNRSYPARWLTQVLVETLDDGTLLSLVDHAVANGRQFLADIEAETGAAVGPDRTITGDPGDCRGPETTGLMYCTFDEIRMLLEVRSRILQELTAQGKEGPAC